MANKHMKYLLIIQFSSVTQSCPTLCNPWIAARQASLSITNSQSSLRLTSIESVMPSNHLILRHPLFLLLVFPSIRDFSSQFFTTGGQSVGVSASESVLPMNIQDRFPLEWTAWIQESSWTQFKSRDITLPTKVHLVKAMVFSVVTYGCESWTVKKAECWRIDDLDRKSVV